MAIDVAELLSKNQQQEQTIEHLQRAVDQLTQQHALLLQALVHVLRGEWDAAQFGAHSAEAFLVAANPSLAGKVRPRAFVQSRSAKQPARDEP